MEHPEDSILLAYTRRQLAEHETEAIYQHLSVCSSCAERWKEYGQISSMLSKSLKSGYWKQPAGILIERVFAQIEAPEEARLVRVQKQREQLRRDVIRCSVLVVQPFVALVSLLIRKLGWSRQTGQRTMTPVPVFSMPAVLFLLMLVGIAAFAYSLRGKAPFIRQPIANTFVQATRQANENIKSHRTPPSTIGATQTNTKARGMNQPEQSGETSLIIKLCTQSNDRFFSRIRICGWHFPAGDRAELIILIEGGQTRQGNPFIINRQGEFQAFWTITDCRQEPTAIYVYDLSSRRRVDSAVLKNITVGRCFVPPQKPGAQPKRQSPGWPYPRIRLRDY
jgi:hypothetical protein